MLIAEICKRYDVSIHEDPIHENGVFTVTVIGLPKNRKAAIEKIEWIKPACSMISYKEQDK